MILGERFHPHFKNLLLRPIPHSKFVPSKFEIRNSKLNCSFLIFLEQFNSLDPLNYMVPAPNDGSSASTSSVKPVFIIHPVGASLTPPLPLFPGSLVAASLEARPTGRLALHAGRVRNQLFLNGIFFDETNHPPASHVPA